jgi:hypothetical protein
MVIVGFMFYDPVPETKIAGQAVGYVQAVVSPRREGVGVQVATCPRSGGAEDVKAARKVPEGVRTDGRVLPNQPLLRGREGWSTLEDENPF